MTTKKKKQKNMMIVVMPREAFSACVLYFCKRIHLWARRWLLLIHSEICLFLFSLWILCQNLNSKIRRIEFRALSFRRLSVSTNRPISSFQRDLINYLFTLITDHFFMLFFMILMHFSFKQYINHMHHIH